MAVVILSLRDKIKFLENIKLGFTGKISRDNYRSEITTQPKNDKFDYMIDATFWNISNLLVLSCKNDSNDPASDSFDKFYLPLVYY